MDAEKLEEFYEYCRRSASEQTCSQYLRYLRKPLDTGNRWSVTAWKKYYKFIGREDLWKSIKSKKSKPDLYVPSLQEILETLQRAEYPYNIIYKVLLESGLRLREACYLVSNIDRLRVVELDGFYRVELGLERGTKKAFWGYLLQKPEKILVEPESVTKYAQRYKLLAPKYLRKYVATKLVELGCMESVIDFIQGRTPSTILTKHYAELLVAADNCYRKYAEWLRKVIF